MGAFECLRKAEAFTGVRVLTWTILSNRFHVLVEIPVTPDPDMPDEELLARLGNLYSRVHVRDVKGQLRKFSQAGDGGRCASPTPGRSITPVLESQMSPAHLPWYRAG